MKLIEYDTVPRHGVYAFISTLNVFYIRRIGESVSVFSTHPKIDNRRRFKHGMYFELTDEELIEHVVLEMI